MLFLLKSVKISWLAVFFFKPIVLHVHKHSGLGVLFDLLQTEYYMIGD